MLERIETVENIPDFLEGVKAGNERLMGFGHRVYKNYDPRARIIKKYLDDVFEVRGKSPLLEVATELEKRALDDDYFTSRKLYPNVDFYSGLIYEALGLPVAMFPVMFAIGRTSGWIAQWKEMVGDTEQKIARPRQIYTGARDRDYVPIGRALIPPGAARSCGSLLSWTYVQSPRGAVGPEGPMVASRRTESVLVCLCYPCPLGNVAGDPDTPSRSLMGYLGARRTGPSGELLSIYRERSRSISFLPKTTVADDLRVERLARRTWRAVRCAATTWLLGIGEFAG